MKTLNFIYRQWFVVVLLITISFVSCKKSAEPVPQQAAIYAKSSADASLASTIGQLYVGTAYKIPTIGIIGRIATGADGTMYVSAYDDDKVFKVTTAGVVSVLAQNVNGPVGLKVAKNGDVYVALYYGNKIVKITPGGVVDTLKLNLTLNRPYDVAIADDMTLYIADGFHKRIIKVSPAGLATVLAGKLGSTGGIVDGAGSVARFNLPSSIKLGGDGYLWVVDGSTKGFTGQTLRRVTTQGVVTTVVNTTGTLKNIMDIQPARVDANFNATTYGNVFIVYGGNVITQYNTQSKTELPITKNQTFGYIDGPIATAEFQLGYALSFHDNVLYMNDSNPGDVIRKIYKK